MDRIVFVPITRKNIGIAIEIAKKIFPYEVSSSGEFLPEKEYRMSLVSPYKNLCEFFIVKYRKDFIGITGYNYSFRVERYDELWIGYFGVLRPYRGSGIGKHMLLDTLNLIKEKHQKVKTVKLYTSNREEEKSSHWLYRCVGFRLYAHRNTKPFHTYYFKIHFLQ